ncbi:hypothetical protein [Streptomyces sp. NPDC001070]
MKGTRVPALLAGIAAALTLSACGVPSSGVIQAGEPASGVFSPVPESAVPAAVPLYFLHDGDLRPYLRKTGDPADFAAVVRLLFGGPTTGEAATATTELPRLKGAPEVTVGDGNTVSVQLPEDVPPLSHLAMLQLACTVAQVTPPFAALPADPNGDGASAAPPATARRSLARTSVHVRGDGWSMTQSDGSCPDAPRR